MENILKIIKDIDNFEKNFNMRISETLGKNY